jgi:hypothetical protein
VTTWHAATSDALEEVGAVIHDAWFDIDDVRHEAMQMLVVPFAQEWEWGPMLDDPAWRKAAKPQFVKTTRRYREERVPFMRGSLRIAAVESVSIDRGAGDAAMLLGVRYDRAARTVTVEGVSGDLAARVDRLDVTAELVNEISIWGTALRRSAQDPPPSTDQGDDRLARRRTRAASRRRTPTRSYRGVLAHDDVPLATGRYAEARHFFPSRRSLAALRLATAALPVLASRQRPAPVAPSCREYMPL